MQVLERKSCSRAQRLASFCVGISAPIESPHSLCFKMESLVEVDDAFGVEEEAYLEVEKLVEGIGVPLVYVQREQAESFVPKHAWKEINNPRDAKATISVAVGEGWMFAKKEMPYISDKLKTRLGTENPSPESIFDLAMGENSPIYRSFQAESIFQSYDGYAQFLCTFFLSSAYQVSTKQLFDKFSEISLDGCMEKERYLDIWWKIGEASLPPKLDRNKSVTPSGIKPFWMKVEDAYNDFCRDIFVSGFLGKMKTTVVDDKAHAQGTAYTAGLKLMRHTNGNVNGHTLHTLVFSFLKFQFR